MNKTAIENIESLMERGLNFRTCVEMRASEDDGLYVEGYAVKFNSPTVLYEFDGIQYKEQIARGAFDGTNLSDVIFNYNHTGKVIARTRNQTLELRVDQIGLFIKARLDGTEEGKKLYDEIKGGYIDRMSFAFTVREANFESEIRLNTIEKIKRIYDVSAVSIPAYDDTSISARNHFDVEIEKGIKSLENERQKKRLLLKIKLMMRGI